jgi:hypothetical protein
MSRLFVLLLSLCVTVLAMEDPPVPKAEPEPSPTAEPSPTNSTSVVSPTIVDHYDRFSLEEDLVKEKEGMENKEKVMHDLLSEDPHLHHVPLTPGELLPSYDVSKDNATKDINDSMETTTKKTFIMKIPVVTKSPMLDAMMNNTKDHDESMMKDDPSIHSGVVHTDNKDSKKPTMMPGHSSSSSSQLVGNNATKVSNKSSGNIISPTFIVAILAVLGSKLC